jgi:hypothetical protein
VEIRTRPLRTLWAQWGWRTGFFEAGFPPELKKSSVFRNFLFSWIFKINALIILGIGDTYFLLFIVKPISSLYQAVESLLTVPVPVFK